MQNILIVGGGFAGVWGALAAATARRDLGGSRSDVRVTLVSGDPYLTIRPRLYEARPASVRVPLDAVLEGTGVERIEGVVTRIDSGARATTVEGADGRRTLAYDRLVLAAGSRMHRPDIPGAAESGFSVDTFDEAAGLRRHVAALPTRAESAGRFTAVVIGAGFTGLEVATELVGRLRALAARAGAASEARVVLVERADVVGPDLGPNPRPVVEAALRALGVGLRLGASVASVSREGVLLRGGEWIPAATVVWAAGLRASELAAQLPVERDSLGRVPVDQCLRVVGVDGVLAAGDVARVMADAEHVAPMSCQHAIPMGDLAGRNAVAELLGLPAEAYWQPDYVTCLDLGAWGALFTQGWDRQVKLTGAWAKAMKETIDTRMIYPPTVSPPVRRPRPVRVAASTVASALAA